MFAIRPLLALSLLALALSGCGDPGDQDKSAGGQTGGESKQSAPCDPNVVSSELGFDQLGPTDVSAAQAMAAFGPERTMSGTLAGRSDTTFHATLGYGGRVRARCHALVVDVSLALRSEDGSFDETIPAELQVYGVDDAVLSASYASESVKGSYRELLPLGEARALAIGLTFSPAASGWVSLEPGPAGGKNTAVAKF